MVNNNKDDPYLDFSETVILLVRCLVMAMNMVDWILKYFHDPCHMATWLFAISVFMLLFFLLKAVHLYSKIVFILIKKC